MSIPEPWIRLGLVVSHSTLLLQLPEDLAWKKLGMLNEVQIFRTLVLKFELHTFSIRISD